MSHRCERCQKSFTTKSGLTRHSNNKTSCKSEEKTPELGMPNIETNENTIVDNHTGPTPGRIFKTRQQRQQIILEAMNATDVKTDDVKTDDVKTSNDTSTDIRKITNLADQLHDVMRTKGITGEKAYYDINRMLFLRFIQPFLDNKLATLMDPIHYQKMPNFNAEYLKYLKLNELMKLTVAEDTFKSGLMKVWDLLSMHPFTSMIFKDNSNFSNDWVIIHQCLNIIQVTLANSHFDDLSTDVKGSLYEHFVNGYASNGGKALGQYFTPRNLVNCIFKLDRELFGNEMQFDTIYDPCAGSGGFLTEMYKIAKEYGQTVESNNILGGEIQPDTYASCIMNILLTTGDIGQIKCGDSLINNENHLATFIATNPPYGIKGLKRVDIVKNFMYKNEKPKKKLNESVDTVAYLKVALEADELYPVQTNDGCALFLQHCIGRLAYGGICNIVVPKGGLLYSNKFTAVRKHLIDKCVLRAVLYVPNDTFTHTSIETAVLFFSKSQTEKTTSVDFYQITDKKCTEYKLLGPVSIEQLETANYSLKYSKYVVKQYSNINYDIQYKSLKELCIQIKGKKYNVSDGLDSGEYPLICSSITGQVKYLNSYDYEGPYIIISRCGSANIHLYEKFNVSDMYVFNTDDTQILLKYLYYYLKSNTKMINEYFHGATLKNITLEDLLSIQVPVPSLEIQQLLIAKYEKNREQLTARIEYYQNHIQKLEEFKQFDYETRIKSLFGLINMTSLYELCQINTGNKHKSSEGKEQGLYPLYYCSVVGHLYLDTYDCDCDELIINKTNGMGKCKIYYTEGKHSVAEGVLRFSSKNSQILCNKYLYYYLITNIDIIAQLYQGLAQKSITHEDLLSIQVPVPSLEKQQQIIEIYESRQKIPEEYDDKKREILDEIQNIKKQIDDIIIDELR